MELKIFENNAFGRVRVIELDNEPMFLGKDIAMCLGYKDASGAIATHCKSGKKVFQRHKNNIGGVNVMYIPESDVYRLIIRSNLPSTDKFQDWVCEEILPSIRKNGYYNIFNYIEDMISDERNYNKSLIYTYLLTDDSGLVKIGRTTNIKNRMRQYATHNPTYKLLGYFDGDIERFLHNQYNGNNVINEWFDLSENQINNIINSFSFNTNLTTEIKQ